MVDLVDDRGLSGFTKIKTRRGFEYIFDQIRDGVADGRFKPGHRLPSERDMAEMFGVSRHGVREAIRGLEMSGLVVSRPGALGGAFIREGDPEIVTRAMYDLASLGALSSESLLEARIILTADVIRIACERASEEDLQRIEDDLNAFEAQQPRDPLATPQRTIGVTNFYHLLALSTHNEVLVMLMRSLTEIVSSRLNNVGPKPLTDVVVMRREFLKALRKRDADTAIDQMTAHLNRLERRLVERELEVAESRNSA